MKPLFETCCVAKHVLIVLVFLRKIKVRCVSKPADICPHWLDGLPTKATLILIPHFYLHSARMPCMTNASYLTGENQP